MEISSSARFGNVWLPVILAAALLSQLSAYSLLEPDEGRYAEIGREMAKPGGDWIIPRLNGVPHFQKPPMLYWATAISMRVFGSSEFAVRLPSALAAIGTLLLAAGIAVRLFGEPLAGRLTLAILATSPLFLFLARTLTPDMSMCFWITAAIFAFVQSCPKAGDTSPRPAYWGWLYFVSMGLGFLTKGPVAFLVPLSAGVGHVIGLRIQQKRGDEISLAPRIPWLVGLILALLIGLSWFITVAIRQPGLANYFLHDELIERFSSSHHGRSKPVWFFIPVLLGGFLPWTVFALRWLPKIRQAAPASLGFFLGWIAVPFVVLSLSGSKLPTYVLPLFPGLAVALSGRLLIAAKDDESVGKVIRISVSILLILMGAIPLLANRYLDVEGTPPPFLLIGSMLLIVSLAIFWGLRWSISARNAVISAAMITLLALLIFPSQITSWNDMLKQQASTKPLADRILKETSDGRIPYRVISCEIRAHGLAYYLGKPVEMTRGEADVIRPLGDGDAGFPILHERPLDVAKLKPSDSKEELIFVVTRTHRFEKDFADREWVVLQKAGDFVLLRK